MYYMKRFFNYKILIYIIFAFIIIGCSSDQTNEEAPIVIHEISVNQVLNRAPKENDFQIEIELLGTVNEENLKQDIQYEWFIEYLKLDITDNSLSAQSIKEDATGDIELNNIEIYLEGCYFLEISKNPLSAMLSIYKPGYYKITMQASNINETKEYSIILKTGDPILPTLNVKVNIPKMEKAKPNDFKGEFYLAFNNTKDKLKVKDIIGLNAKEIIDDWYDTGYSIDPFLSFNIQTGTHVLDSKPIYLCSLGNCIAPIQFDDIVYSFEGKEKKSITFSPIVLRDFGKNNTFTIAKMGDKKWAKGNIFISYLIWGINEDKKDEFIFFEKTLNNENNSIDTNFNNKYLAKIFIGSFGHRVNLNEYYVYFGPEGTDTEELDPKNNRDYTGLPYGYLLGKLGKDGNVFPIGSTYSYIHNNSLKIYIQDEDNNFIVEEIE